MSFRLVSLEADRLERRTFKNIFAAKEDATWTFECILGFTSELYW